MTLRTMAGRTSAIPPYDYGPEDEPPDGGGRKSGANRNGVQDRSAWQARAENAFIHRVPPGP